LFGWLISIAIVSGPPPLPILQQAWPICWKRHGTVEKFVNTMKLSLRSVVLH
jgi:hypothetical protein